MSEDLSSVLGVGEKVLEAVEEVRVEESRLMESLGRIVNSQPPLQIMASVVRQMEATASLHQQVAHFKSDLQGVINQPLYQAPLTSVGAENDDSLRTELEGLRGERQRFEHESARLQHDLSLSRRQSSLLTEQLHSNENELTGLREQH